MKKDLPLLALIAMYLMGMTLVIALVILALRAEWSHLQPCRHSTINGACQ